MKLRAVVLDRRHRSVFANVGAGCPRRAGEGGRDEARVRLTVVRTERAADGSIAEPWITLPQRFATQQFELEPVRANGLPISFELRHVGVGARELDVAGRRELAIAADDLREPVPHRARASRERQFGERAALLAHAAVIDAARLAAAQPAFEQNDRRAAPAQVQCRRAAGGAAADDRDIGDETLGHGRALQNGSGAGSQRAGSRAVACIILSPPASPHAASLIARRPSALM